MFSVHVAYLTWWTNQWPSVRVAVSGTTQLARTYLSIYLQTRMLSGSAVDVKISSCCMFEYTTTCIFEYTTTCMFEYTLLSTVNNTNITLLHKSNIINIRCPHKMAKHLYLGGYNYTLL